MVASNEGVLLLRIDRVAVNEQGEVHDIQDSPVAVDHRLYYRHGRYVVVGDNRHG